MVLIISTTAMDAESHIKPLFKLASDLFAQRDNDKKELERLQEKLLTTTRESNRKHLKYHELEKDIGDLTSKYRASQEAAKSFKASWDSVCEELGKERDKNAKLEKANKELDENLTATTDANQEKHNKIVGLEDTLARTREELERQYQCRAKETKEINDLKKLLDEPEKNRDCCRKLACEKVELLGRVTSLQRELEKAYKEANYWSLKAERNHTHCKDPSCTGYGIEIVDD